MSVGYRRCSGKLVSIMTEAGTEHSLGAGGLLLNEVCLVILGMNFGVLYFWVKDGGFCWAVRPDFMLQTTRQRRLQIANQCPRLQHDSTCQRHCGEARRRIARCYFRNLLRGSGTPEVTGNTNLYEPLDQHNLSMAWSKTSQTGHAIVPHDTLMRLCGCER